MVQGDFPKTELDMHHEWMPKNDLGDLPMDSNILLHFGFSHILLLMRAVRAEASAFCKALFVESGVSLDTFGTGSQRARISPRSQSLWRILCLKAQLLEEILKKLT